MTKEETARAFINLLQQVPFDDECTYAYLIGTSSEPNYHKVIPYSDYTPYSDDLLQPLSALSFRKPDTHIVIIQRGSSLGGECIWMVEGLPENAPEEDKFTAFSVPKTEEGIWQAFLLHHAWRFLPLRWHAAYGKQQFIFSFDDLLQQVSHCRRSSLNPQLQEHVQKAQTIDFSPQVTPSNEGGIVQCYFWSNWDGLYRSSTTVSIDNDTNKVFFKESATQTVVPYSCGIIY